MRRGSVRTILLLSALAVPARALAQPTGLVSVDTYPEPQLWEIIEAGFTDGFTWEEAYGTYVDVNAYVPGVNVEDAWEYVHDIHHLEEWTISVRNLAPMADLDGRTRYSAFEAMPGGGDIYFLEEKDHETHTVDWWVGHSPEDIWMRYYVRVLDAEEVLGRPGIVLTWVNFGHANFDRDPNLKMGFLAMKIAHAIERDNLGKILQWRAAGNTGPVTTEVRAELGLISLELYDAMSIWFMVMAQLRPTVTWDELYGGEFIGSHYYLPDVPRESAWSLLASVDNLPDWTVSLRNVLHLPDWGDYFLAVERLVPRGAVIGKHSTYPASATIDLRMAPLFVTEPVMSSTLRVLDGPVTNGKPGTVVVWIQFRHDGLSACPLLADYWHYLPVLDELAAGNVAYLLGL